MKAKIVTAYWMDVEGYPFQGTRQSLKTRYLGSLISHCKGIDLPIICYTHSKNEKELLDLKNEYKLDNLEIKILELSEMKYHSQISQVRDSNFDNCLEGRGPEIMWGKFQAVEQELDGFDRVYWIDCGLQHPGIFPWMYCVPYGDKKFHVNVVRPIWADCEITQYDFTKLFNTSIFEKLNNVCDGKIATLCCTSPQIGYPYIEHGIETIPIQAPYPIGGMIGGDTKQFKKYLQTFWETCEKVLDKNFLCTEEVIMKVAHDINKDIMLPFIFGIYQTNEHDQYHFEIWNESFNKPKPLYMVWHDIINY
jgi:hypothetical protein